MFHKVNILKLLVGHEIRKFGNRCSRRSGWKGLKCLSHVGEGRGKKKTLSDYLWSYVVVFVLCDWQLPAYKSHNVSHVIMLFAPPSWPLPPSRPSFNKSVYMFFFFPTLACLFARNTYNLCDPEEKWKPPLYHIFFFFCHSFPSLFQLIYAETLLPGRSHISFWVLCKAFY